MRQTAARIVPLVLTLIAAALGAWGGGEYARIHFQGPVSLHDTLHGQLKLTPDQQQRIEGLENTYAVERRSLETEMRAANKDLALAYSEHHAYTPQVQAAINRFHMAMAALQKATVLHVTAMRVVLTPDQAAQFDATVIKSLTTSTP